MKSLLLNMQSIYNKKIKRRKNKEKKPIERVCIIINRYPYKPKKRYKLNNNTPRITIIGLLKEINKI